MEWEWMVAQVDATNPVSKTAESGPTLALQGNLQVVTGPSRAFCAPVMAQALRVAGQGTPVLVIQFLKGGIQQGPDNPMFLCQGLRWVRADLNRCLDTPQLDAQEQQAMHELWKYARRTVQSGRFGLVVLDELSLAIHFGLIPESEVIALLIDRPSYMDIIVTGPQMPAALIELADQVTEQRRSAACA
jgi:cob(I)alamin adenosyltransferase